VAKIRRIHDFIKRETLREKTESAKRIVDFEPYSNDL